MSPRPDPSPSFCVSPWLDRLVDEQGFIRVCCVANGAGNFVTDAAGACINVADNRPEVEIVNSPRLRDLRRTMLAGEWDPICEGCRRSEAAGGGSSRVGRNHHLSRFVDEALADTAADGSISRPRIRRVDIRLGNHCNLTCRMCSPASSRLWSTSYNDVQPESHRIGEERMATLKNTAWVDDPAVWSRFRDLLPDVEWLHFAGGEPMIVPAMIDTLRMAVGAGCASRIHLSYNTNLTVLPDAVRDLWPHFRRVSVSCSIDAYGALNDYIRRPSKWRDIDRNLHLLDRNFEEWHLSEVYAGTTVQIYNLLDLDRLYTYLRSEFAQVRPLPALSMLTWPAYLSARTLPEPVLEEARAKLLAEKERREYQRPELAWLLGTIDTAAAFLQSGRTTTPGDEFRTFTRESERLFGDSLERAAPALAAVIRDT